MLGAAPGLVIGRLHLPVWAAGGDVGEGFSGRGWRLVGKPTLKPYGHVQPLEEQFGRKNLSFKVSHSRAWALNWAPLPLVKKKEKKNSVLQKRAILF